MGDKVLKYQGFGRQIEYPQTVLRRGQGKIDNRQSLAGFGTVAGGAVHGSDSPVQHRVVQGRGKLCQLGGQHVGFRARRRLRRGL